jgi:hypothetical protein
MRCFFIFLIIIILRIIWPLPPPAPFMAEFRPVWAASPVCGKATETTTNAANTPTIQRKHLFRMLFPLPK